MFRLFFPMVFLILALSAMPAEGFGRTDAFAPIMATAGLSDLCNDTPCPRGREPVDVCLVDSESYREAKWTMRAQCGLFSQLYVVDSVNGAAQKFSELSHSCKSIKRLVTAGHSSPGNPNAARLDLVSVIELRGYSCLFEPKAEIQLKGCSSARGCVGDLFLYNIAKNLLAKGGTVIGPTYAYFTEGFFGISLNGKYRKLTYDPQKTPPDTWEITGLTFKKGDPGPKHCATEIRDVLEKIKVDSKNQELSTCGYPKYWYNHLHLEPRQIGAFEKLIDSLSNKTSFSDDDSIGQLLKIDDASKVLYEINSIYGSCKTKTSAEKISAFFKPYLQYGPRLSSVGFAQKGATN